MTDSQLKTYILGERYPGMSDSISKLHNLIRSYDRLQVLLCNGEGSWRGYDVKEYSYDNRHTCKLGQAEVRMEDRIMELTKSIDSKIKLSFSGDPRGNCIKFLRESRWETENLAWLFYY